MCTCIYDSKSNKPYHHIVSTDCLPCTSAIKAELQLIRLQCHQQNPHHACCNAHLMVCTAATLAWAGVLCPQPTMHAVSPPPTTAGCCTWPGAVCMQAQLQLLKNPQAQTRYRALADASAMHSTPGAASWHSAQPRERRLRHWQLHAAPPAAPPFLQDEPHLLR